MTQSGHPDYSDDHFMEPASLFLALESVNEKPGPFSVYTASELWTDEHTSEQMLAFHLNGEIDVSSRRTGFIDNSARWLQEHFELSNSSRLIDFGCGPGLYTSRIARLGAEVFGIDFSWPEAAVELDITKPFVDIGRIPVRHPSKP